MQFLYYPTPEQAAAINAKGSEKIPDRQPFEYRFVSDGHNGKSDSPEFHVAGNMRWHPSAIVHKSWARIIGNILEERFKQEQEK
ncbi:hypothetical protein IJT17_00340 [bacterium]|nr:hypothetical protein [bacterium]